MNAINSYEITFGIAERTKIVVQLEDPLSLVCWSYAAPIMLQHNEAFILLAEHPTYFNIKDFRDMLQKALNNELFLDASITSDIGYLCEGYHYNSDIFSTNRKKNNFQSWIGYKYRVWESNDNETSYITWLYNNKKSEIIFEVTPSYPYFYCDIKKQKHFIPFKKWILKYKPYFVATISREKAQEWLVQAEYLVNAIDENVARWKENERQGRAFNDPY